MANLVLAELSATMEEAAIDVAGPGRLGGRSRSTVVEVTTDKTTMDFESPSDGVLHIMIPAGSTVPVGVLLVEIMPR